MPKISRRLFALLLMILVVIGITGCQPSPNSQTVKPPPGQKPKLIPTPIPTPTPTPTPTPPVDPVSVIDLDNILQEAGRHRSQVPSLEKYLDYLGTPGK